MGVSVCECEASWSVGRAPCFGILYAFTSVDSSWDCGVSVSAMREPLGVSVRLFVIVCFVSVCASTRGSVHMCKVCPSCACMCLLVLYLLYDYTVGICEVARMCLGV